MAEIKGSGSGVVLLSEEQILALMRSAVRDGRTKPETTLMHLRMYGAVARWPYGHDALTVIAIDPAQRVDPMAEILAAVLSAPEAKP